MEIRSDVRIYTGVFIIILAALAVMIFFMPKNKSPKPISSFEECAAAGYPVMQSYPPQCTLPNGKFFVRQMVK